MRESAQEKQERIWRGAACADGTDENSGMQVGQCVKIKSSAREHIKPVREQCRKGILLQPGIWLPQDNDITMAKEISISL